MSDIKTINDSFKFFGKAIGENNLGIVLLNADRKTHSVERAISILDNISRQSARRIDYSSTPIIVYSNFNPEKTKPEGGFVTAIGFRGAEPRSINGVITRLTQSIREAKRPSLAYEEISLEIERFIKHIKLEVNLWDILVIRGE